MNSALDSATPPAPRSQAEGAVRSPEDHALLIAALRDPRCYPHPVSRIEVIETHISSVLLTGEYAYKVKKPVNLGFLDFTTLDARRRYCEDELRLNRRTAPGLYLDVVAIAGTRDSPAVAGAGPAVEYAVRMRQFPPGDTLDHVLRRHALAAAQIDALAAAVAAFHGTIAVAAPATEWGNPEVVRAEALENFEHIERLAPAAGARARAADLRAWTEGEFMRLRAVFTQRKADGRVRECHGDLHLGNVALVEGMPVMFDCIEFNDSFRWIDVMSEVAFTVMDLIDHREPGFAFRFLNDYLEATGDYPGIAVLRFYLVQRAMVRAKIAMIRMRQPDQSVRSLRDATEAFNEYLRLAESLAKRPAPALVITCGLSGSGKTTAAQTLLETIGAVRLRSDVERKRLHGLAAAARTDSAAGAGIYGSEATRATYERLAVLARAMLPSGFPVIVDATFLRHSERQTLREVAHAAGAGFVILAC
ncbi:MAG: AAA family ATPase, partial [Burkholderiales bacterium]